MALVSSCLFLYFYCQGYAVDEDLIDAQDRIMQKLAKKIQNLDGETERLTQLRDKIVFIFKEEVKKAI